MHLIVVNTTVHSMACTRDDTLEDGDLISPSSSSPIVPLTIQFSPPAYIQRRALVLATLKNMKHSTHLHSESSLNSASTSHSRSGKCQAPCKSLLDVGTGDGGLLSYLVKCDDEVPIERLVGFDPSGEEIQAAVANTLPTAVHEEDLRWRPLEISLYTGGVADVDFEPGSFDVVTAIEVLEHLDPPDVEALPRVCLGYLRPSCFIVTTPNRDFNEIFRRIERHRKSFGSACSESTVTKRYFRDGVEIRHHDHRFEMTRKEFEVWAQTCAGRYGYEVTFAGVGSIRNAFGGQDNWKSCFPEDNLEARFGHSTQAAIFYRLASDPVGSAERVKKSDNKLNHVKTHLYPWGENDGYPPGPVMTSTTILKAETYFRPLFDPNISYFDAEEVTIVVDCKDFFEASYLMRRACRFDLAVYLESASSLIGQKLILPPDTDTNDAEYALTDEREEPCAFLIRAEVIETDELKTCIKYTFDVTEFSHKRDEVDCDSLSSVSCEEANNPRASETLATPSTEWYHP